MPLSRAGGPTTKTPSRLSVSARMKDPLAAHQFPPCPLSDEVRPQQFGAVMARRHQRDGQQRVKVRRLGLSAFAVRAVRTVDPIRATVLSSIRRDQHVPGKAAHGLQAAALF
jgi:hypothetical protein